MLDNIEDYADNGDILGRRQEFSFLWESQAHRKVVAAARGAGKTVAVMQFVLWKLLRGPKNGSAVVFASTLMQVRKVVAPIMRKLTQGFDKSFVRYNGSDYVYKFVFNDNDIRELYLMSYEAAESNRGVHPHTIVLDECGLMPTSVYGYVIIPMLSRSNSDLIAIGTPQGHNQFYELAKMGQDQRNSNWETYILRATDLPCLFEKDFLHEQRQSMTQAQFEQEYMCSFDAAVFEGSVYGEFLDKFTYKNHNVSDCYCWNPDLPVFVAWDIGYTDYVAMWFFQVRDEVVTFIDYFEDNHRDIPPYAEMLARKDYMYKYMILPFDGASHDIRGAPVADQLSRFGFRCEVLPKRSEREGIDEARKLLKTCRFNSEKCDAGLNALKAFKWKLDRKTGKPVKSGETEHDDNSHCADAFRYAAMSRDIWNIRRGNGRILLGHSTFY